MVTFTDSTGYFKVYATKSKKGAAKAFGRYYRHNEKMKVLSKKGHKIRSIKVLYSDRGGEYTNSSNIDSKTATAFNQVCKELKVEQMFTNAGMSKMNGKAERTNRTVAEGMRCALIDSGFSWKW